MSIIILVLLLFLLRASEVRTKSVLCGRFFHTLSVSKSSNINQLFDDLCCFLENKFKNDSFQHKKEPQNSLKTWLKIKTLSLNRKLLILIIIKMCTHSFKSALFHSVLMEVSFGEMSGRGNVWSGNCLVGTCPSGNYPSGNCLSGICPRGSIRRGSVQSGKCPRTDQSIYFNN